MNTNDDIYSFYKLISEYKVVIPVIQRSYAEGRMTKQAEDVRKSIISSIILATVENKPLFFDFVYGNIVPSESKKETSQFIPFDGQQRLTTLFLFYRYIFECADEPLDMLKNFSYETRASAKEFIEKLCDNRIIPNEKTAVLSKHLTNQNWFFNDWNNDPTISSMLTVLDEIHLQISSLENVDFNHILILLKDSASITFHFVNMQENNLPSATYVKMNARGKGLTAFENFKASLEEYLGEKNSALCEVLKNNIDGKWLDLFYRQSKPNLPDALIMAFFNRHLINIWTLQKKAKPLPNEVYNYRKIESDLISFPQIDTFISWDIYKSILENCPIEKTILPIFNFLKTVCEEPVIDNIKPYRTWNVFKGYNDSFYESYPFRVAFFAMLCYFRQTEYDEKSFSHWMRVVWNIIENSTIDSPESYLYALRFFEELSAHSHTIYEFLSDSTNKISSDFAKEQLEEEQLKAKKILESPSWEEKILLVEQNEILLGKINVLFQNGEKTTEQEFSNRFNLLKTMYENEDSYHIIKILISYFEKPLPSEKLFLGNTKENIKQLVTKTFFNEFRKIVRDKTSDSVKYDWTEELATTNLLNVSRGKYLKRHGNRAVLWGTQGCIWTTFGNNVWGNIILGEKKRNLLLMSLYPSKATFETDYKGKDYIFFSGWETYFKFENHCFGWRTHDSRAECDVYLMEAEWTDYKKRKSSSANKTGTESDTYFAFNATDDMLKDTKLFADKLRDLISESREAQ